MRSFHRPLAVSLVIALVAPLALASACGGPPSLTVTATPGTLAADGVSTVDVVATVSPADAAAMLTFSVEGIGDLAATNVAVVNGVATAKLIAPPEEQLSAETPPATVRVSMAQLEGLPVEATTTVSYVVPTTGAAVLRARTERDAVVITSGEPHVILITARRVPGATLSLSCDDPSITVPATVTLEGEGDSVERTARIEVPAPATAKTVSCTISAEGVAPVVVALRFINLGDAEFDVGGTYAQIQYNAVRISGFDLLQNDPDCVRAESVSLVEVTQVGNELTMTTTACSMTMPPVNLDNPFSEDPIVINPSPGTGWIDAANAHSSGPVTFTLPSIAAGMAFDVPVEAFGEPMVVGAELADNDTSELPTSADDDAEKDHDGDGNPGVTIEGGAFDQHICYRNRMLSMDGVVVDSSLISGTMLASQESVIFGSAFAQPTVEGLPATYHMARVDGGGNGAPDIRTRAGDPNTITCEDVASYVAEMRLRFAVPALPSDRCPNN
jgi:hypothetical protein